MTVPEPITAPRDASDSPVTDLASPAAGQTPHASVQPPPSWSRRFQGLVAFTALSPVVSYAAALLRPGAAFDAGALLAAAAAPVMVPSLGLAALMGWRHVAPKRWCRLRQALRGIFCALLLLVGVALLGLGALVLSNPVAPVAALAGVRRFL